MFTNKKSHVSYLLENDLYDLHAGPSHLPAAGSPDRRIAGSPDRRIAGSPDRRIAGSPDRTALQPVQPPSQLLCLFGILKLYPNTPQSQAFFDNFLKIPCRTMNSSISPGFLNLDPHP
jgi:hypothetical protein